MHVMMADVEESVLAAAANSLAADGVEVATCVTDVSDADSVEALARATLDRDAIVSNRFWILTHPESADLVADRYRRAADGRNPQLAPMT